jgi:superfamily II DNA or RNA helicase
VLAYGFAQFIYNGGVIKIVTNHFLYNSDRTLLSDFNDDDISSEKNILRDLQELKTALTSETQQFLDCLKFLIKNERLEIVPVMLLPNKMAHYKQGIFVDAEDNRIFMDGSCNFTANGLLENGENISVCRSWGEAFEKRKVDDKTEDILSICSRKNSRYRYLKNNEILNAVASIGTEKSIGELLSNEAKLLKDQKASTNSTIIEQFKNELNELIKKEQNSPKFPFNSKPREYQEIAYKKWTANNFKGVFAMATGTGKTITSLNCLLKLYQKNGCYQAIVLVPGKTLLQQWIDEVLAFNFKNIVGVSSDFPRWKTQLSELVTALLFDKQKSFIIITTYKSFTKETFQNYFKKLPKTTLLIADEAHNLGSPEVIKIVENLHLEKRIALSATITRQFDDDANELIEQIFDSPYPYTYNFSMKRAIDEGILCQYDYFPHFVYLEEEELEEYVEITKKLQKFFDFDTGNFKASDAVQKLLIKRKTIVHKASAKLKVFSSILKNHYKQYKSISRSFIYAPEGEDEESHNILDKFLYEFEKQFPNLRPYVYSGETTNRDKVLKLFDDGFIDSLFSMKCLDEGVDLPKTELAIFCSSTGNPRQFIQRRGRILRTHRDKARAIVHDMVVLPSLVPNQEILAIERKLLKDELTRVIYFASLARNYYATMNMFDDVAKKYDIDLYSIQNAIEEKQ